jgi:hypothetical protein
LFLRKKIVPTYRASIEEEVDDETVAGAVCMAVRPFADVVSGCGKARAGFSCWGVSGG